MPIDSNNATIIFMTKLVIFFYLIFNLFQITSIFADDQHLGQRSRYLNFTIQIIPENIQYSLVKLDSFALQLEKKQHNENIIIKLDSELLAKIDEKFSKNFVENKYLRSTFQIKNCDFKFKLTYRDDALEICSQDLERVKTINLFISQLEEKFNQKI